MSTVNPHNVTVLRFTEANLLDKLDSLKNDYPVAISLTYGELEELAQWIKAEVSLRDVVDVTVRLFLENLEGRAYSKGGR